MSPLQAQYPLSPRKFWKKLIEKGFIWFIILLLLMAVSTSARFFFFGEGTLPSYVPLLPYAAFVLWAAIVLLYAWYVRVYIRRYYYDAGDNFVTIKKGVFAPAEIHVQYPKIQDVYVDQDILDRIMGLYDVHIASATMGSAMEAHIDGVEHTAAEGLKNLLLQRIQGTPVGGTPNTPMTPHTQSGPVTLSESVSSKQYPIGSRWVVQNIIVYLFSSAFLSGILTFYFFSPSKNSTESLGDLVGIAADGIWFWTFVIIFGFHIIYALLWRATYYFEFLPEYILMRSGVIARSEVHLPYRAVQDVNVKQGIIERILGLATVNIENAAAPQMVGRRMVKSGVSIPGQSLEKANHITEVVRTVTLTKNTAQTGL